MKKILLIVIDGLGDTRIKELGNKTPLEAAETPNMDFMAENGMCGLVKPVFTGVLPTSEEGHFSLFGYDPKKYRIKRGAFSAAGAGIKVKKDDVLLRGNLATIDENMNMIDRRAGRVRKTEELIKAINGIKIGDIKFLIKSAGEHRLGIAMRGKGLSPYVSDGDPHYGKLGKKAQKIVALDKSREAKKTAAVLNEFLIKSSLILKNHSWNKKRIKQGLPQANYILLRGASGVPSLPSFKKRYGLSACCVAGKLLYKQVGKFLGMSVIEAKGATGRVDTNLEAKVKTAVKCLNNCQFVFLHIKATDSLAEDGNFLAKKQFIEKIDKNFAPLLKLKNVLIVITADHSTCSKLKRHCGKFIPLLVFGAEKNGVKKFGERYCQKEKFGLTLQTKVLSKILEMA